MRKFGLICRSAAMTSISAVCLVLTSSSQDVQASPITYTGKGGTISGTIGATSFKDAAFTLTTVADTSTVVDISPSTTDTVFLNEGVTKIHIDGVGTATFTGDSFGVLVEHYDGDFTSAGFANITAMRGILSFFAGPSVPIYDLVTTPYSASDLIDFSIHSKNSTSLGTLHIKSATGNFTFSATVPEPSTFALAGLGGLGLVIATYRRRRLSARTNRITNKKAAQSNLGDSTAIKTRSFNPNANGVRQSAFGRFLQSKIDGILSQPPSAKVNAVRMARTSRSKRKRSIPGTLDLLFSVPLCLRERSDFPNPNPGQVISRPPKRDSSQSGLVTDSRQCRVAA
jgi:hypothetical protein